MSLRHAFRGDLRQRAISDIFLNLQHIAKDGAKAEALVARLWTNRPPSVVSFGTDGAFFQKAGLDTIVIGPGGMAQMHQPDEFITEEAMDEGLQFLERLLDEMSGRTA